MLLLVACDDTTMPTNNSLVIPTTNPTTTPILARTVKITPFATTTISPNLSLEANNPPITVLGGSVPAGQEIVLPQRGNEVSLKKISGLPLISLEDAITSVFNRVSLRPGITIMNKPPVTLTAAYGLVSFGRRGNDGKWIGGGKTEFIVCNAPKQCTNTGVVLDYIENRPMWILDFGNTYMMPFGQVPSDFCDPACTPFPGYNHSVYAVDAQTKATSTTWFYIGE